MFTYYLEILVLSLIQGISEFIPVSSSAHLILASKINKFNINSLQIDVSLHAGSLIAILFYFWKDLIGIFKDKKLLALIFLGSTPVLVVGLILYSTELIYNLRNIKVITWSTLIFAILLFFSDKRKIKKKIQNDLKIKDILIIGLSQILAFIPGASRSGVVMTSCRYLKFNRVDAAKISFFLSIPALAGASFLGLNDISKEGIDFNNVIIFSTLFSFIFSFLTIKFLLYFLNRFSLKVFVFYRIFLFFILLIVTYT